MIYTSPCKHKRNRIFSLNLSKDLLEMKSEVLVFVTFGIESYWLENIVTVSPQYSGKVSLIVNYTSNFLTKIYCCNLLFWNNIWDKAVATRRWRNAESYIPGFYLKNNRISGNAYEKSGNQVRRGKVGKKEISERREVIGKWKGTGSWKDIGKLKKYKQSEFKK